MNANKFAHSLIATVLLLSSIAVGQGTSTTVSIAGCREEIPAMRIKGLLVVEVNDLARITAGSVTFKGDKVILFLPRCAEQTPDSDVSTAQTGLSREFKISAIEAMASIREWGGILQWIVQNGYVLKNSMTGSALDQLQGRAADKIALASVAATTDDDRRGLELLRNEYNNIQVWSDAYTKTRNAQAAASLTMSPNALDNDQEAQKLVRCGQFLAQMFGGESFQDNASCH